MLIFWKTAENVVLNIHYRPDTLTDQEKAGGVLTDAVIPEPSPPAGKYGILNWDPIGETFSWTYADKPLTPIESKLADHESAMASDEVLAHIKSNDVDEHGNLVVPVPSKESIGLGNVENYGIATQLEAEAGTVSNKYMTPQRVKQSMGGLGYVKIHEISLGANSASVSFTGVGIENYRYLKLIIKAKNSESLSVYSYGVLITFNSDSGQNYGYNVYSISNSGITDVGSNENDTRLSVNNSINSSHVDLSGIYTFLEIDISNISSSYKEAKSFYRNFRTNDYSLTHNFIASGTWRSANKINTITIATSPSSLATGSNFLLLGMK